MCKEMHRSWGSMAKSDLFRCLNQMLCLDEVTQNGRSAYLWIQPRQLLQLCILSLNGAISVNKKCQMCYFHQAHNHSHNAFLPALSTGEFTEPPSRPHCAHRQPIKWTSSSKVVVSRLTFENALSVQNVSGDNHRVEVLGEAWSTWRF